MSKTKENRSRYPRKNPYTKNKLESSAMKIDDDGVLNIHSDTENDMLKSDSESGHNAVVPCSFSTAPVVDVARNEMLLLLKEIRDSQSTQCTKNDLLVYGQSINKKFTAIDQRVTSNASTINSMESRIKSIETSLKQSNHEAELSKQNVLSRNLSIMGVPPTENEDLKSIALKIFSMIGCQQTTADIFGCYRIRKGNSFTNIFIVKINDFAVKHQILKSKVSKAVRLNDVMSNSTDGNPFIFINNHVTPFFGKLLAEGRKAVKEKKIHSVWMTKNGCHLRFEENGHGQIYRSADELYGLISANRRKSTGSTDQRKRSRPVDNEISPNNAHKTKK